jgi:hypothetical protein
MKILIPFAKAINKPFSNLTKSDLGDYFDSFDDLSQNSISAYKKLLKCF